MGFELQEEATLRKKNDPMRWVAIILVLFAGLLVLMLYPFSWVHKLLGHEHVALADVPYNNPSAEGAWFAEGSPEAACESGSTESCGSDPGSDPGADSNGSDSNGSDSEN